MRSRQALSCVIRMARLIATVALALLAGCCSSGTSDLLEIDTVTGCLVVADGYPCLDTPLVQDDGPNQWMPVLSSCIAGEEVESLDDCNTCTCLGSGMVSCTTAHCGAVTTVLN